MAPLLELAADVDERLLFRRQAWARPTGWGDFARFVRALRAREFDAVLDLQGLGRSGLLTALARAPIKAGFADARELAWLAYRHRVVLPAGVTHAVERNLALADAALAVGREYEPPRLRVPPAAATRAGELLATHRLGGDLPLLAVAPAARWAAKTWPVAFFADVIGRVMRDAGRPIGVWLLGAPDERAVGAALAAARPGVVDLIGQTSLAELVALLRRSSVLLTNDSGPMHLAAALGCPTVAMFGPTDPAKVGPYGEGHRVFQTRVSCAPCRQRRCPLPRQLCLDDVITPAGVAAAVVSRLGTDAHGPARTDTAG